MAMLTILAYPQSIDRQAVTKKGKNLTGSWVINVLPAQESGVPPFVNLATCTKDGGIVNASIHLMSSGHGQWTKTQGGGFAVTFIHLQFDENGQFAGTVKIRAYVMLDNSGNQFGGPFKTDFFDAGGNPLFSIEGTVDAARISVEPLD
jgi:hypothetical protein